MNALLVNRRNVPYWKGVLERLEVELVAAWEVRDWGRCFELIDAVKCAVELRHYPRLPISVVVLDEVALRIRG